MEKQRGFLSKNIILYVYLVFYLATPIIIKFNGIAVLYYICLFLSIILILLKKRFYIPIELKNIIIYIYLATSVVMSLRGGFGSDIFVVPFLKILPIVLIANFVKTEKEFYKCIDICITIVTILAFLGIMESITQINIFDNLSSEKMTYSGAVGYRFGFFLRSHSINSNSICHGLYLMFASALILYRYGTKRKAYYLFSLVIVIINILMTFSRTAIIAEAVVLVVLLYKMGVLRKPSQYLYLIVGLFLFFFITKYLLAKAGISINNFAYEMFGGIIDSNAQTEAKGIGARFYLFKWVGEKVGNNYLFGMGSNSQFSYYIDQWHTKMSIENYYLSTFYHKGIVGVVILIAVFIYLIKLIRDSYRKNELVGGKEKLGLNFAVIVAVIVYCITCLSVSQSEEYRMLIFLISLLVPYNKLIEGNITS